MIFFITNTLNSVLTQESETTMTNTPYNPHYIGIRQQNLFQEALRQPNFEGFDEPKPELLTQEMVPHPLPYLRTCPSPAVQQHWDQTRHFLEEVLHMENADILPVAYWAWHTSLWVKGATDDFTRQLHERSGVLVAPNGSIVGYTTCVPVNPVNIASGVQWSGSILRPDTCEAYGLDPNQPVSVGDGYWFAHPAIMHGQQIAHVRYVSVGMGHAPRSNRAR